MSKSNFFQGKWPLYGTIAFMLCIFMSRYGWTILNPLDIDWLMTTGSDWTPDFLAWQYYRHADWSFPLGIMEGYSYPGKVSIGLTGAIPILAVPFKLMRGVLPANFQYFGIWMLLCFILQGYFAFKIVTRLGIKNGFLKLLAASFIALSYSFLDRFGHLNLCAHWLILAGIYVYMSADFTRSLIYHSILIFLSVWIHPYLVLFTIGIASAHYFSFSLTGKKSWLMFPVGVLISLVSAVIAWISIGNHVLKKDDSVSTGFGYFSSNLNTFWNPKVDSYFVQHTPYLYEGQYEGTAYLGVGYWWLLCVILISILISKTPIRIAKHNVSIILAAFILFIFSLSHIVSYDDTVLFTIPLSESLDILFSTFRASGRYVWLLQYLLLVFLIWLIAKSALKTSTKAGLLSIALLLNVIDFSGHIKSDYFIENPSFPIENFNSAFWDKIIADADTLTMYPPHTREYNHFGDDTPFVLLASSHHKNINTGHLARFDVGKRKAHESNLVNQLQNHPESLKNHTLISTTNKIDDLISNTNEIKDLTPIILAGNHTLFAQGDYIAFVPNAKAKTIAELQAITKETPLNKTPENWLDFAERHQNNIMLIAVKDDAGNHISQCDELVQWFEEAGSQLGTLQFRESYVGIFEKGKLVKEIRDTAMNPSPIRVKWAFLKKNIDIMSADMDNGNEASIFVDDVNYAANKRGLNITILNDQGEIIESTIFDTFQTCFHLTDKVNIQTNIWRLE